MQEEKLVQQSISQLSRRRIRNVTNVENFSGGCRVKCNLVNNEHMLQNTKFMRISAYFIILLSKLLNLRLIIYLYLRDKLNITFVRTLSSCL